MSRKQFIATSIFLGLIPAGGLLAVLAFGVAGSASNLTLPQWGLYGTTFIAAIFTLASPVAVVLLIPKDGSEATLPTDPAKESLDNEEELVGASDADNDSDFDDYEDESDDYDSEVASLDDDGFEDEFDDFDDDEDFA